MTERTGAPDKFLDLSDSEVSQLTTCLLVKFLHSSKVSRMGRTCMRSILGVFIVFFVSINQSINLCFYLLAVSIM